VCVCILRCVISVECLALDWPTIRNSTPASYFHLL
jgi:hypothetical protein